MIAAASSALASPFISVGSVVRTTAAMLWARGRGWGLLLSRTLIDYRSEIGDPMQNSIVGACVGWICRNFPEAPVRIARESDPLAQPIRKSRTGPGAMLLLLERPNPYYSGVLQWMATLADFILGNAYWIKVRNGAGRVVELWWVPQAMMEPVWDQNDPTSFIEAYAYTVDGIRYRVEVRDVVHFRNGIDPANTRKGLSRLGSLFREIFTDEESANFTASLLRNLGVPGVVLAPANTTGPKGLGVDAEKVKTSFMEKFGGDKRGEPLVFTAPTEVKVLSWSPQQMDLKALRRIPEERTSAVLGIPAGVAGLGAGLDRNTFSNYGEANKAAYVQGVIPLQRLMSAELEVQLLIEFVSDTSDLDVFFDASVTQAMAEAADAIWKRGLDAFARGAITRKAFKQLTKQPFNDADDVYLVANNIRIIEGGDPGPGGANPPRVLLEPANRPALGPGGAVESRDLTPAPVRCGECNALVAELAAPPYQFTCRNGHAVIAGLADVAA